MKSYISNELVYESAFHKKFLNASPFSEGLALITVRKYGVIDCNGNVVVDPIYDEIEDFREGIAVFSKDGKYGAINEKGRIIAEPIFDQLFSFCEGKARFIIDRKYGYINSFGGIIANGQFDQAEDFHKGIALFKSNGKWGAIDSNGNIVLEPTYEKLGYYNGDNLIYKNNGMFGLIDRSGNTIVSAEYEAIKWYLNGYSAFKKNKKWGFIDENGRIVIDAKYDFVYPFSYGLAHVKINKQWGAININGDIVVEPKFDYIGRSFSDGLKCIKKNNKWGFIDQNGQIVIEPKYENAFPRFKCEMAVMKLDGKTILIDKADNTLAYLDYDYVDDFHEGAAKVEKNGKYGFIDKTGDLIVDLKYDDVSCFSEGLAIAKQNNIRRFINNNDDIVIDDNFDLSHIFKNNLAIISKRFFEYVNANGEVVFLLDCEWCSELRGGVITFKRDGKWGFVDRFGKTIIDPILDHQSGYINCTEKQRSFYIITKDSKKGFVYNGKLLLKPVFEYIIAFNDTIFAKANGRYDIFDYKGNKIKELFFDHIGRSDFSGCPKQQEFQFCKDGKYGLIDSIGNILLEPKYELLDDVSEGLAAFRKNGKWGYIDYSGKVVIEPGFKVVCPFENGYAKVIPDGNSGKGSLINKLGEVVLQTDSYNWGYKDGLFWSYDRDGHITFFDDKIEPISDKPLKYVRHYYDLIVTKEDDKYGLIQRNGRIVLPSIYDEIYPNEIGVNLIKYQGKYGILDRNGDFIVEPIYDGLYLPYSSSMKDVTIFKINGKCGLTNKDGNVLLFPKFDWLGYMSNGLVPFRLSNNYGYLRIYENIEDFISQYLLKIESESEYINPRVNEHLQSWSQKGEFEKTADWQKRISTQRYEEIARIIEVYKEEYRELASKHHQKKRSLEEKYLDLKKDRILKHFDPEKLQISRYDADNETFLITIDNTFAKIVLPVDIINAPAFKDNWESIKDSVTVEFDNKIDDIAIKSIAFTFNSVNYCYDSYSLHEYDLDTFNNSNETSINNLNL